MPLRFAVLSRARHLYSTRRLVAAARARGHAAEVVDFAAATTAFGGAGPLFARARGRDLTGFDVAVGRIAPLYTPVGCGVLRAVAAAGVYCSPTADALALARDKVQSLVALAHAGVPVPRTAAVNDPAELAAVAGELGGYPLVIKGLRGTQGEGVALASDDREARRTLADLAARHVGALAQEYVAETGGADVRAFVCGPAVVAAMTRTPAAGEFRSNLHRGGRAEPTTLSAEERAVAVAAAAALGLEVAGVDLLRAARGPLVLEVNASPGLEGIERATGRDVAGAVVDALARGRTLPSAP